MLIPYLGIIFILVGLLLFVYLFIYFGKEDIISVTLLAIITTLVGLKFLFFHESLQLAITVSIIYFLPFVLSLLLILRFGKKLFLASIIPSFIVVFIVASEFSNTSVEVLTLIIIGYLILFFPTAILINFYLRSLNIYKLIIADFALAIFLCLTLILGIPQIFVFIENIIALAIIPYVYTREISIRESVFERLKLNRFQKEILRKLAHSLVFFIFLPSWILELMVDVGVEYGISGFIGGQFNLISSYPRIQAGVIIAMANIFLIALFLDFMRAKMRFPLVSDILLRDREKEELAGYVYLLGATLFIATFFSLNILFASIGASVIGDAFAALIGMRFGKHKIRDRSWEGTIAEFITASLTAYLFVPLYAAILVGLAISVTDVVIDGHVSDNIVFPIIAAITLEIIL